MSDSHALHPRKQFLKTISKFHKPGFRRTGFLPNRGLLTPSSLLYGICRRGGEGRRHDVDHVECVTIAVLALEVMSDSHALHPRWPPLLKIEISSNGQNCFILSQNVPKFELYKHNDELFNIYYGFFFNFELLPILTDYAN
jgi:hypothetical protein